MRHRPPLSKRESLSGLPVLVVDDNATNRRILEEQLTSWGMRPTLVASGQEALGTLQQAARDGTPFSLVLLDAHMPHMDGFTVAELIKENPDLARATIMMLTSGSHPKDAARCRELGIASYLTKPIKQSDLVQCDCHCAVSAHLHRNEPSLSLQLSALTKSPLLSPYPSGRGQSGESAPGDSDVGEAGPLGCRGEQRERGVSRVGTENQLLWS